MGKIILHVDFNGFYAGCEEVYHPEYRKVPRAVAKLVSFSFKRIVDVQSIRAYLSAFTDTGSCKVGYGFAIHALDNLH